MRQMVTKLQEGPVHTQKWARAAYFRKLRMFYNVFRVPWRTKRMLYIICDSRVTIIRVFFDVHYVVRAGGFRDYGCRKALAACRRHFQPEDRRDATARRTSSKRRLISAKINNLRKERLCSLSAGALSPSLFRG